MILYREGDRSRSSARPPQKTGPVLGQGDPSDASHLAGCAGHGSRRRRVLSHYLAECEVLRLSGRAKRIHRMEELAGQDADFDEVARAFRDDVARYSDMMSPGLRCLAGG